LVESENQDFSIREYPFIGGWQPEILMILSFIKIPPNLPFPKGGLIPLFGKEGKGEILRFDNHLLLKAYSRPWEEELYDG
jgi:hypothetical protein